MLFATLILSLASHITRLASIDLRNLVWPPDAIVALMASVHIVTPCPGMEQFMQIHVGDTYRVSFLTGPAHKSSKYGTGPTL